MTTILYLDTETSSDESLSVVGVTRYFAHPSTHVTLLSYAIDDGPAAVWDTRNPAPADFTAAWVGPHTTIVAHNVKFDWAALQKLTGAYDDINRWYCTSATARLHNLPGGLAALSTLFGIPLPKLAYNTKKSPFTKGDRQTTDTAAKENPAEWELFLEYAIRDIEAMRGIHRAMPRDQWTPFERAVWLFDHRFNRTGFRIDPEVCAGLAAMRYALRDAIHQEARDLTNNVASSAAQTAGIWEALRQWNEVPDVARMAMSGKGADYIKMRATTPENSRSHRLLTLAIEVKPFISSTAGKAQKATERALDGRVYDTYVYSGSTQTRRWSGEAFQPLNMPRPDPSLTADDISAFIDRIKAGRDVAQQEVADQSVRAAGRLFQSATRGILIPDPGHAFMAIDLSNIEARITAYVAHDEERLNVFRRADAGEGSDIYRISAGKILGKDPSDITGHERQTFGKVTELAFSYGGASSAFLGFVENYRVDLGPILANLPVAIRQWLDDNSHYVSKDTVGLALSRMWRGSNPCIVALWKRLDLWFRSQASQRVQCARYAMQSGQSLLYWNPQMLPDEDSFTGFSAVYTRFKGPNGNYERLYGAKILENIAQSLSRDVFAWCVLRAEAAIPGAARLLVHDELVIQFPTSHSEQPYRDALLRAFTDPIPWLPAFPLAAEITVMDRYRKA